jgi:2'-5' RNA ligase
MQLAIQIATHELGVDPVGHFLMPHVTVLDGWHCDVEEAVEPVRWTATEFVLLHGLRFRHECAVLGRWPLGGRADRPRGLEEPAIAIGW